MNDDFQTHSKSRSGFRRTVRLVFDKFMRMLKLTLKHFPMIQELAKKMGMEFDWAKIEAEKIYKDIPGGKAGRMGSTVLSGQRLVPAYMSVGQKKIIEKGLKNLSYAIENREDAKNAVVNPNL